MPLNLLRKFGYKAVIHPVFARNFMTTILLTIHILIAIALVGTVLLQRNEEVVWELVGHQAVDS